MKVIKLAVAIKTGNHCYQLQKFLYNIPLSKSTLYVDEIIVDYQCRFRRKRTVTDQIFCIRPILEKNRSIIGH
jgi:hypothetical protein